VVCFSYLAAAELWQVPRFPLANYGAEVVSVERSIAADAPMAAAVLAALDMPTLLLANETGNDQEGSQVLAWLQRYGVNSTSKVTADTGTPRIIVVADDDGTRTWFPHLSGVSAALAAVDLSPLISAAFAYVDCYQLIEPAAVRVIAAARSAEVPLLVNLGGSLLSSPAIAAVRGCRRLIMQTNVDDAANSDAPRVAYAILAATGADWAVITAGQRARWL
jgi:sugar/nucleoside kinase (ribokinase family)